MWTRNRLVFQRAILTVLETVWITYYTYLRDDFIRFSKRIWASIKGSTPLKGKLKKKKKRKAKPRKTGYMPNQFKYWVFLKSYTSDDYISAQIIIE